MSNSKSLFGIEKKTFLLLIVVFLVWRVLLFVVGYLADYVFVYAPSFPYADSLLTAYHVPRWLFSWANFDGVHYLTIAEKGYIGTGLIQAFFPFFPFVILRTLFLIAGPSLNTLIVGLLVTNISLLLSVFVWYKLLRTQYDEKNTWIGITVLLLFPLSFYFVSLYTESIFFLLIVSTFLAARKGEWRVAAVLTVLATATRVVGIFLLPALFVELWQQWRTSQKQSVLEMRLLPQLEIFARQRYLQLMLICMGSLGLIAYMVYLQRNFQDSLYFLHVQSEFGGGRSEGFVTYPQVLWRYIKILLTLDPTTWRYYSIILEFLAGTLGLAGLLLAAKKVRISYVIFALGAFFMPTFTGTFSSMPRYILVCFPLYLLIVELVRNRPRLKAILFILFTLALIVNTMLFIQGYWVS